MTLKIVPLLFFLRYDAQYLKFPASGLYIVTKSLIMATTPSEGGSLEAESSEASAKGKCLENVNGGTGKDPRNCKTLCCRFFSPERRTKL